MLSLREVKGHAPGRPAGPHPGLLSLARLPHHPPRLTAGQVLPLSFLCECYRTSELARLVENSSVSRCLVKTE